MCGGRSNGAWKFIMGSTIVAVKHELMTLRYIFILWVSSPSIVAVIVILYYISGTRVQSYLNWGATFVEIPWAGYKTTNEVAVGTVGEIENV